MLPSQCSFHPLTYILRPFSLIAFSLTTILTTILAISVDTAFYTSSSSLPLPWHLLHSPVIAPINSLLYNASFSNLSLHGLHPPYQHFLASLPLLLGPALVLIPLSYRPRLSLMSALSATFLLSFIPHQEPRFLLPAVPLILTSIHLPKSQLATRYFLAAWILFNSVLGILMGIYHQGGVIPAQIWLGEQYNLGVEEVLWWRTYSPPIWLLDGNRMRVSDLMGMQTSQMIERVNAGVGECGGVAVGLVSPTSSADLDVWTQGRGDRDLVFEQIWAYRQHIGLDDMDIGKDGFWRTLKRVVGRRGLAIWKVRRKCE